MFQMPQLRYPFLGPSALVSGPFIVNFAFGVMGAGGACMWVGLNSKEWCDSHVPSTLWAQSNAGLE